MRLLLSAWLLLSALALWLPGGPGLAQEVSKKSPSALEQDASGWVDLLAGKDLSHWKRIAIAPDTQLSPKNPWRLDANGPTLQCDGVGGIKEMFLFDREWTDGIFHVEWRFRPVQEGRKDYNSGVYVRSLTDGKIWVQAQVAHLDKPPLMGDLFADTLVDGQTKRTIINGDGDKHVRPPGEWNAYEITCKGKELTVAINGTVATRWKECPIPRGHVGLQAEFFYIEFRNLKFKELR